MDVPCLEQSDSDSGESWTLLENNSVYADDAPEFIEEHSKCEAQHHEKDEDTDGISIISDSDHETPSPPPTTDEPIFDKCHLDESKHPETVNPEYIPIDPHLHDINDGEQDPPSSQDFLIKSHAKHKTYVHRRNKRLSTVLNIIVLGSVITAAGVAIGHMWGAKNDCTMQSTSSVNKILSNLYKLQEENAYLRNKLKELTFVNNKHTMQHHKAQPKQNKCRRVFEESLSNNEPRKFSKCVDENYNNVDNFMEHLVKPIFEKEFVADIDKLKTVYLQNKSWLDDEISRRLKIEEELLKKYKNEVNSGKEKKNDLLSLKRNIDLKYSEINDSPKGTLGDFVNFENPTKDYIKRKVTYADSLQPEDQTRFRSDEKISPEEENNEWYTSKHNINNVNPINSQDFICDGQLNKYQKSQCANSDQHEDHLINEYSSNYIEPALKNNNNYEPHQTFSDNWTEVKPKFRRNEERYETDYDKSFTDIEQKTNRKVQEEIKIDQVKLRLPNEKRYITNKNSWTKHNTQEMKNKAKKEKIDSRQNLDPLKNDNNDDRILENVASADILKDDRYVVNQYKQEKKKKGYTNLNKKQKRKSKHEKWNMKGEFGEKFEAAKTAEDFVLNYSDKNENSFDRVTFIDNLENIDKDTKTHNEHSEKSQKTSVKEDKFDKETDNKQQGINWFEKRAVFRTEARKKYYEQFGDTSPNNSSWYFRRMRKREQCRAKGENSTFRKFYKEKKNNKMKN